VLYNERQIARRQTTHRAIQCRRASKTDWPIEIGLYTINSCRIRNRGDKFKYLILSSLGPVFDEPSYTDAFTVYYTVDCIVKQMRGTSLLLLLLLLFDC